RALFATHYHEMSSLSAKLDGVDNATVSVKEWDGDVIFLHEVKKGTADRSYGVQVARLAGLPSVVVARAKVVLEALEKGEREGGTARRAVIDDLPLFAATQPAPPTAPVKQSMIEDRLRDIMPDDLTPKDALALVYELRALLSGTEK
ncbi:MAG: DNA mismatch repair protein MutS, partial [Alphaproteobacteria bacterium]|nr:DNA mismatch repair protein MutS [Alphaproteobacteria bacterium]